MRPFTSRSLGRALVPVLCAAWFVPVLLASKNFVKPEAKTAINYPAHDFHRDEKVGIAADPYDKPDKAKIFSTNFAEHGFMPIFFIVTNDGDQPVSIANMEITLITGNHSKLTPVTSDDLYRRLTNPQMSTRPSPIPLPHKVKGTLSRKEMDEIESSQFAAKAVEPHTTQSGFLFFDVGGINSPLRGANIDVTGVADAKGSELMYFEIPADKYLDAPVNP
ncbi:MAG TPA: hypothetical protein VHW45_11270 [Candidatus Sulfotelmatobacter sp.]|jgi:hypothetical protein|nr:hypothetical protein [Candidatus Sulfotelmatobacter sp.]